MSTKNYLEHMQRIHTKLIVFCHAIERCIDATIEALDNIDFTIADSIYRGDDVIDNYEKDLEQDCLKVLLLEKPVAGDFRDVSAVLKMITDLERIGDQCADICEITLTLKEQIECKQEILLMGRISCIMVKDSVRSYIDKNMLLAAAVESRDDKVDTLFAQLKGVLCEISKGGKYDEALKYIMIGKYFERIADHAVNICEWARYTVSGARN